MRLSRSMWDLIHFTQAVVATAIVGGGSLALLYWVVSR